MTPRLAILIVNYQSSQYLPQLLESILRAGEGVRLSVSIVDNTPSNTENQTVSDLAARYSKRFYSIVATFPSENLGYGRGNNCAWDALTDTDVDAVVVLNPDVLLDTGSLKDLVEEIRGIPLGPIRYAVTIQQGIRLTGRSRMRIPSGRTHDVKIGEAAARLSLDYPGGHFLAIPIRTWMSLGGFSESIFLYCEEIDLVLRSRSAGQGETHIQTDSLTLIHAGAGSTRTEDGKRRSSTAVFHATRSRVVLYKSHRKLRPWLATMIPARLLLALARLFQGYPSEAKSTLAGLLAGVLSPTDADRTNTRPTVGRHA